MCRVKQAGKGNYLQFRFYTLRSDQGHWHRSRHSHELRAPPWADQLFHLCTLWWRYQKKLVGTGRALGYSHPESNHYSLRKCANSSWCKCLQQNDFYEIKNEKSFKTNKNVQIYRDYTACQYTITLKSRAIEPPAKNTQSEVLTKQEKRAYRLIVANIGRYLQKHLTQICDLYRIYIKEQTTRKCYPPEPQNLSSHTNSHQKHWL